MIVTQQKASITEMFTTSYLQADAKMNIIILL